ncbi:geranylgeranyl diphosphate synthase type II [Breznakia sp. PF5-3]|uniref:polyprenyl synthetase family protein n=1 Tax=unclassified Breznakia TaxID=2623764 RepID=UPI00240508BD|nr:MULTISPECIES: farnesyl diphosphate synthase [unclassified Breznakia]MDL2276472.1 polyprenyl synthetase family protein [Breznakia sp. OttesenSCG-928-G09]MDF9823911.1 geranylgeranyl diphosphate synthase type II [Breznakia sp. PM6-1]MDF9834710.1 geranylgeranyl diphosphate synthase type II [Breznakia sp. PF5-3]MDF9836855.1 geranylgeranyl diphosphate synthase type II [Breznakia sp. PFB2-8]MDF9858872.1 geranylgeranyl diphosphate synthase type II [Breznakia sp. PH5-24]
MKKVNIEEKLSTSLAHLPEGKVKEAAQYALMSGGKRFRPNLLFATLDAYRISQDKGVNAAIGIEMIHTYSLIHDDLPAMDNDTLRRGVPTCHIKYGEDIAILAGDALLSEAFHYANCACEGVQANHLMVEEFVKASGLSGMIHGQELDIANVNRDTTLDELKEINLYKTSKLIVLSFVAASIVADHYGDKDIWLKVGNNVGLIFQIQDDLLDIHATSAEIGKDQNSDAKNNKVTYASLLGSERCNEIIQELLEETKKLLDTMMIDKFPLIEELEGLLDRKK